MLRILQTCFSPSWGGLEIQALEVSSLLLLRGHRVTLAAHPDTRLAAEAGRVGVPLLSLKVRGYAHPLLQRRLSRFLREERIDLIHAQHSRDIATVVPAMLLSGRRPPVLLSKRMGSSLMKKDLLHRFTYRHVARILAVSEVIRRNVIATLPVPPERVITFHDAVDTVRFDPAWADGAALRAEFGFTARETVVGFVGRFSPGKGHEELLQAGAILQPRFPDLRWLIVGEPSRDEEDYAARIRHMATELGLDGVVRFAGFRKEIPTAMAAFDCFAFPSHAESFGLTLIEAMAMERAVVSTNCDGVLDIMVDGETGLMVPPRDPAALAEALARLVEDPPLRQRFGAAARRRICAMFDQERQIDRLEGIYAELLA
jgi:glycosyltransferase involved in cell wall biosynthesis